MAIRSISVASMISIVFILLIAICENAQAVPRQPARTAVASIAPPPRALLDRYCVPCHNDKLRTARLTLETLDVEHVGQNAEVWEKVFRKLRTGVMPPAGRPRPAPDAKAQFVAWLEASLDRAAQNHPDPGRPAAVHRLNRTEYGNAIRDLLDLQVDAASLLPPDDSGAGFDNIADVLSVSPSLLERYMSAARKVSRLAVGDPTVRSVIYSVPRNLVQDERISEDLPLGSRGGAALRHYFPVDGEYLIKLRLQRNFLDEIRGMADANQIEIRIDGVRVKSFTVGGEQPEQGKVGIPAVHLAISAYLVGADSGLETRVPVKAGSRLVSVAFLKESFEPEGPLQPPLEPKSREFFQGRHGPAGLGQIEIRGPEKVTGLGDTPSRRRVFVCRPLEERDEAACARQILSTLARRAFRRPVTEADLRDLLALYNSERSTATFEAGIEMALRSMLTSPYFLFRVERDPASVAPSSPYRLTDLELASRLSFFLWSSIPDDQLLDLAVRRRLTDLVVLEQQVKRMLADPRSKALITNFAGQWLSLRQLRFATPDEDAFPEFDENLREAFLRETELLFESVLRENRSVVDLLAANETFLNNRLARYYGIPNIFGNHFRRVTLDEKNTARAGVLGHASVLTVTSYATRTSPVLRGKWILDNVLGAPPPAPPPNVPDLQEKSADGRALSMRQAMEQHRKNPVCASCHAPMDPLGFALENFDAIGRWRTLSEAQEPVDASGTLPDGTAFQGAAGLRQVLLSRRQEFVGTVITKLLIYATGRDVGYRDFPTVRAIAREAAVSDYEFSSLILGIVRSGPFQMRRSAERPTEAIIAADP